jgi:hypothetical protein
LILTAQPQDTIYPEDETMTDTRKPAFINAKRRGFLQGAAVAGGVVASGAATSGDVHISNPAEEPAAVAEPKGYRLTEHVKRYYERARF